MSKSLRNTISLDEVVEQYGADALRLALMFRGPLSQSGPWDVKTLTGVDRFLKKTWWWVTDDKPIGFRDLVEESREPSHVVKLRNQLVAQVTNCIDKMQFNTAVSFMMSFIKAVEHEPVSKTTLETFVLVLSPFAPHLGEELWQRLGHPKTLAYERWPQYDKALLVEDIVEIGVQVNGKRRDSVRVDRNDSDEKIRQRLLEHTKVSRLLLGAPFDLRIVRSQGVPRVVNVIFETGK